MLACAALAKTASRAQIRVHRVTSPFQSSRTTKRLISDHYATLGVSPTASQSEIKKAFFDKAKKVHPDVNKGDPNAQKKFVDLSAAYEVLKNKDKRAQYDAQRSFGDGGFGSGFGGQQTSQPPPGYGSNPFSNGQAGGFNPFRQSGGNPYYQPEYQQQSGEDFMKWYQSHFRDSFRDFDDFSRGQTMVVEERMPDGSIRIRVIKTGPSAGRSQSNPYAQNDKFRQRDGNMADAFDAMFGNRKSGFNFFRSIFNDGFRNAGQNADQADETETSGIPFGSGSLDFPSARIIELATPLSFSISSGRHIGTMSHKILSGDQGDVLTCHSGSTVLAKARNYLRNGIERIIIETGNSKRVATVEAIKQVPDFLLKSQKTGFLQTIKNNTSLYYEIFDDAERKSGYMAVSPFRRSIIFYDTRGEQVAAAERKDIVQNDLNNPTRDDWSLNIFDTRIFDSSLYVFASAFSTLTERKSTFPLPGARILFQALSNRFGFGSQKK